MRISTSLEKLLIKGFTAGKKSCYEFKFCGDKDLTRLLGEGWKREGISSDGYYTLSKRIR